MHARAGKYKVTLPVERLANLESTINEKLNDVFKNAIGAACGLESINAVQQSLSLAARIWPLDTNLDAMVNQLAEVTKGFSEKKMIDQIVQMMGEVQQKGKLDSDHLQQLQDKIKSAHSSVIEGDAATSAGKFVTWAFDLVWQGFADTRVTAEKVDYF